LLESIYIQTIKGNISEQSKAICRDAETCRGGEPTVIALGKVKWFGNYNSRTEKAQDFGFITPDDSGPDLFVHKMSLIGVDDLKEGDPVSFEPSKNPRNGKLEARDVKLFTVATSPQLVALYFNSNDQVFWEGVVQSYLEKRPVAQAAAIALKKLETLRSYDKTLLVSSLSDYSGPICQDSKSA